MISDSTRGKLVPNLSRRERLRSFGCTQRFGIHTLTSPVKDSSTGRPRSVPVSIGTEIDVKSGLLLASFYEIPKRKIMVFYHRCRMFSTAIDDNGDAIS